eukprot:scaffold103768_cov51-Phaeocystis_antarctica.AAC.3
MRGPRIAGACKVPRRVGVYTSAIATAQPARRPVYHAVYATRAGRAPCTDCAKPTRATCTTSPQAVALFKSYTLPVPPRPSPKLRRASAIAAFRGDRAHEFLWGGTSRARASDSVSIAHALVRHATCSASARGRPTIPPLPHHHLHHHYAHAHPPPSVRSLNLAWMLLRPQVLANVGSVEVKAMLTKTVVALETQAVLNKDVANLEADDLTENVDTLDHSGGRDKVAKPATTCTATYPAPPSLPCAPPGLSSLHGHNMTPVLATQTRTGDALNAREKARSRREVACL